jgi:hypothetical protein
MPIVTIQERAPMLFAIAIALAAYGASAHGVERH